MFNIVKNKKKQDIALVDIKNKVGPTPSYLAISVAYCGQHSQ